MTDEWPDVRLGERFERIERDLERLRTQVEVFAPTAVTTGGLVATVEDIEEDVRELKADVKKIVGESVVKQIITISIPMLLLAAIGLVTAIVTGKLPL